MPLALEEMLISVTDPLEWSGHGGCLTTSPEPHTECADHLGHFGRRGCIMLFLRAFAEFDFQGALLGAGADFEGDDVTGDAAADGLGKFHGGGEDFVVEA